MNYKSAAESMFPNVGFRWAGDSADPDSLAEYANIQDWDRNNTGTPKPSAAQLEAFWADWIVAHPIIPPAVLEAIRLGAKDNVRDIPGWARWTTAEAGDWYAEHVSDLLPVANLAEANEVLANMATTQWALIQMILELRNETWPGLQAGEEWE